VSFIRAGRTFTMPGPGKNQTHLWMVLTDPDALTDKVIAVMVVSEKPHTDKTMMLNVGDHPFIQHPSNIDYGTADLVHRGKLEGLVNSAGKVRQNLSPKMLEAARAGIFGSSRCRNYVKEYFSTRFDTNGRPIITQPGPPAPSPPDTA
jgi:hypothetical protein